MDQVLRLLEKLSISFEKIDHPPVFTVAEAENHFAGVDALHTKNLFLRNKKGDAHFLVIIPAEKRVDLVKLSVRLGTSRLSMASADRLQRLLCLTPGSVSIFGLINDKNREVKVIIDSSVLSQEKIAFHPNINTSTLIISKSDFLKFIDFSGNETQFLPI